MRPDDVGAVVVFYGTDDGDYSTARAAYLGHFAEHDDFEPLEAVRALEERIRAAGREVTFHIYPGTGHWFVEPNQPRGLRRRGGGVGLGAHAGLPEGSTGLIG